MARFELLVNGVRRTVDADPATTLLEVLRDVLDLTGTKYGCGEGQCGACAVLVEGKPTRACLTKASAAAGKPITTIEGIARDGKLHPLQEAFVELSAMQCGYCTSGMIVEAFALLQRQRAPGAAEIAKAMEGHVCRCGAYSRIVEAIEKAAGRGRA